MCVKGREGARRGMHVGRRRTPQRHRARRRQDKRGHRRHAHERVDAYDEVLEKKREKKSLRPPDAVQHSGAHPHEETPSPPLSPPGTQRARGREKRQKRQVRRRDVCRAGDSLPQLEQEGERARETSSVTSPLFRCCVLLRPEDGGRAICRVQRHKTKHTHTHNRGG